MRESDQVEEHMYRLRGFDYKRPFFYMVTLRRLPELAAFSQISDEAEPSQKELVLEKALLEVYNYARSSK